jgi:hypothetical protein
MIFSEKDDTGRISLPQQQDIRISTTLTNSNMLIMKTTLIAETTLIQWTTLLPMNKKIHKNN